MWLEFELNPTLNREWLVILSQQVLLFLEAHRVVSVDRE